MAITPSRIAPGLLIAMPQLQDPNFARTVVLMMEHGEDGSVGLVINRPGSLTIAELTRGLDVKWGGDAAAAVGYGGPVMTGSGWLIHPPLDGEVAADPGTIAVTPEICVSRSMEVLRRVAVRPPRDLLFVLGYAGWGEGQLKGELASGSWLHTDATRELVFETPAEAKWAKALESIGVDPTRVVPTGGLN